MQICLWKGSKVKKLWERFTTGRPGWLKQLEFRLWLLQALVEDMLVEDRELITSGTRGVLSMRRLLFFWSIVRVAWMLIWRMRSCRILRVRDILLSEKVDKNDGPHIGCHPSSLG